MERAWTERVPYDLVEHLPFSDRIVPERWRPRRSRFHLSTSRAMLIGMAAVAVVAIVCAVISNRRRHHGETAATTENQESGARDAEQRFIRSA